ncbi:hypothetical protein P3C29_32350, partial [Pseudomonas sp. 1912-s]|uniref:hypothetical protein n=2 Tax=Pseudomonas sp. 1912-s TaxID=3033802 RepID=UPI0023DED0C2
QFSFIAAGLPGKGNELFFQAHGVSRIPGHDGFPAKLARRKVSTMSPHTRQPCVRSVQKAPK